MRSIVHIHGDKRLHWVGDGFYVKTLINHLEDNPTLNYSHTDPFLLLDYGEPTTFAPNPDYQTKPYGVGQHPHKGFETVTIVYAGEISHADSAGGRGDILEGDVQWMTAGRGIMHEEFHSQRFGQRGGVFSMAQLWINLPQKDKLSAPKYQSIKRGDIPVVDLLDTLNDQTLGTASIIAGDHQGTIGIATTFTPINLWDIEINRAGSTTLTIPNSHNVMIVVQQGELLINDVAVAAGKLVQFTAPTQRSADTDLDSRHNNSRYNNSRYNNSSRVHSTPNNRADHDSSATNATPTDTIKLTYLSTPSQTLHTSTPSSDTSVKLLLLSGEPIGEPIVGYGPFVMTTKAELKQTFRDYQLGNFV